MYFVTFTVASNWCKYTFSGEQSGVKTIIERTFRYGIKPFQRICFYSFYRVVTPSTEWKTHKPTLTPVITRFMNIGSLVPICLQLLDCDALFEENSVLLEQAVQHRAPRPKHQSNWCKLIREICLVHVLTPSNYNDYFWSTSHTLSMLSSAEDVDGRSKRGKSLTHFSIIIECFAMSVARF